MSQKKKKKILLLAFAFSATAGAVFLFSRYAQAIDVEEIILKDVSDDPRNLCQIIQLIVNIKNLILMIGGPIAALMIIIGGIAYGAAQGNSDKTQQAKKIMTYAILGMVIIILAWVIVGGIITALFGKDFGSAWYTIECNIKNGGGGEEEEGEEECDCYGPCEAGEQLLCHRNAAGECCEREEAQ